MQSREETVSAFHEYVNMTPAELDAWLASPESRKAGTGVGHDSGTRIADILRRNPERDPEAYEEEDMAHMRKVVAYCKRHLAQEDKLKETKTEEELEHTKSTISLKNWGHDPMKTLGDHEPDADEGAVANEDKSKAEEAVQAEEAAEANQESTRGAAKRKHDEVTTEEAVAVEEEAVAVEDEEDAEELFGDEGSENEDEDEGEVNVSADDQPEEEAEEPARKKAKGTDGEVKSA